MVLVCHLITLNDTNKHLDPLMSSNIRVQRVCQHCNKEFTARTTVTRYCSEQCSKRAYKARMRDKKINKSRAETFLIKSLPIEMVKAKEYLTVGDVSVLLSCSKRTVYRLIEDGSIKAVNLAQRMTRIKRSEIDRLLELSKASNNSQCK